MELTEFLLAELRKTQRHLDEARASLDKLGDVPMRTTGSCVYRELMVAGYEQDMAWSLAGRIIGEGEDLRAALGSARAQAEVLVDIIDDMVGTTSRPV